MPVYVYRCKNCSAEFELLRPRAQASQPAECPQCGQRAAERIITACRVRVRADDGSLRSAGSVCSSCTRSSCTGCSLK